MGRDIDHLDLEAILDVTRRLLAVQRGEAGVDDRDSLAYQTIVGPEDAIAERFTKDAGRLRRNLLAKVTMKGDLAAIGSLPLLRQVDASILFSRAAEKGRDGRLDAPFTDLTINLMPILPSHRCSLDSRRQHRQQVAQGAAG